MFEKLLKFFKANLLTIFLAIVPPLVIWYYLQRDTKDLAIEILSNVPVVSIEEKYADGIEISYNKSSISSLTVVDAKINNSGNQPIERSDFDIPLCLKYYGNILSPIQIIEANPSDLPISYSISNDSLLIEPLLMNSGDYFTIRTKISNIKDNPLPLKAYSRIKGVNKIEVVKAEPDANSFWTNFILGVLSSLLAAISLFSIQKLLRKARFVISFPGGIGIELSNLENTNENTKRVSELAEKLQITRYDFKSNLLLLRLKIESLLRELARRANLPPKEQIGSLSRISRILEERGYLSHNVASLIRDISPSMNRELHEYESYLSDEEYDKIQRAALTVVAELEFEVEIYSKNEKLPNQQINRTP